MTARRDLLALLLVSNLMPPCQSKGPDPMLIRIEYAYAVSTSNINELGNIVQPDPFVVHVIVSTEKTAPALHRGDVFPAAFEVKGDAASYGATGGLKFTVENGAAEPVADVDLDQLLDVYHSPFRNYYSAVSETDRIFCNDQNRMTYRVQGRGWDNVTLGVNTAAMPYQRYVTHGRYHATKMENYAGPSRKLYHCPNVEVPS